jgi:predicted dehydrogenase
MKEKAFKEQPKLGFAGVGWIGMKRLKPLADSGWNGDLVLFDPNQQTLETAQESFPHAKIVNSFEELISADLDGIVISTPSALHAKQTEEALYRDLAVFCQKPLGRNMEETERVVSLAKDRNLNLGVDFSYRHTEGIHQIKSVLERGELGKIYAVETIFHNAYGPDKDWYYKWNESGGGCLIDLGSHLIDLIFYLLEDVEPKVVFANLVANGKRLLGRDEVEDFAEAQLLTDDQISIRLACSWRHAVGKDAAIHVRINGTQGGLEFQNVNGSFYDFNAGKYDRNSAYNLCSPPDAWEGRTLIAWVKELEAGKGFNKKGLDFIKSAKVLDDIYTMGTS